MDADHFVERVGDKRNHTPPGSRSERQKPTDGGRCDAKGESSYCVTRTVPVLAFCPRTSLMTQTGRFMPSDSFSSLFTRSLKTPARPITMVYSRWSR